MNRTIARQELALEPDFRLGPLDVRPSSCRVLRGDAEVRVEALTMSALVVLARADGATVTKEELVNDCWQGRFVSDDAIARTISKVRLLARGVEPQPFVLETVPKVGYRLVPAETRVDPGVALPSGGLPIVQTRRRWIHAGVVAVLMLASFGLGLGLSSRPDPAGAGQAGARIAQADGGNVHSADVADAILSLSSERLAKYLDSGWNVDWTLDTQGTTALTYVPQVCQHDAKHDQQALLKIAKQLVSAGSDPAYRNTWGDTAYVIAREGRYCGPHHPVTEYLRSITPGATADPVDKQVGARTP